MAWILVLTSYAAYFIADLRPALKAKNARVLWPCVVLFAAGFAVQMASELNIPLPSPVWVFTELFSGWVSQK